MTEPPDPSLVHSTPRPDWYMLAIFSLFALMPHRIESYAIVIGPVLTVILLFSVPFFSSKGERSPIRRPWAMFGSICVVVFVFGLFLTGLRSPWSPAFNSRPLPATVVRSEDTLAIRGAVLFYQKACLYCHKIEGYGGATGPDLSRAALRLSADQMALRVSQWWPEYAGLWRIDE
ncbi:c-type cytochrome [Puia sp. P3]|uniref:c-type cytochrome n=1 Tax=Puia sp. P3 TaxID=3423952 RepID=UPI003D6685ED